MTPPVQERALSRDISFPALGSRVSTGARAARSNRIKLIVLAALVVAATAAFLLIGIDFSNERLFNYAIKIRIPKIVAMLLAAFAIGTATVVFQSIVKNRIITPCLLGMNALYTLIHTAVVFVAGSASALVSNGNLSFVVDLLVMGTVATFIYSYLFKVTRYNVLYVLLVGTVLTSFFGSIQSTLVRVMDPNEYETLLNTLVASFNNINTEVIILSLAVLVLVAFFLRNDLKVLDVVALGKPQAINLGVDYDRTIRRLLIGVTLYIAVATAMVGPISFLGLIIANLGRQFLTTHKHSQLIAGSALFGMLVIIGGQIITERIFHYAVPISVFISVVGGIYFLYLLLREKGA